MESEINIEEVVDKYIETLDKKGTEAATDYAKEVFGLEGSEVFDKEAYHKFADQVVSTIIERNVKMAQDEETAEAVEEEVKDEADA